MAKINAKMKVRLRGDTALFVDDFVDALLRKLGIFRQPVGRDAHRLKELFTEEFAGMDVEVLFHSLVIIRDFHIVGVLAIPAEADSILVIDSDAVLTRPVAFERFQVISRWKTEFMKGGRGFELSEFSQSDFVD